MGIALNEKRLKREIKKEVKNILSNLEDVKDVSIVGEERRNPKFPVLSLDFLDSQIVEGKFQNTLWKVSTGVCCFLKDLNLENGKEKAEDIVGQACDLIIEQLPQNIQDVHKVEVVESSDNAEIEIKNETLIASAIMLDIYYFIY